MTLTALVDRIDRRDADALTLAHDTQLGHTDHCDRPCQTRWAGLTTGEHDFAVVDPTGREHCAHCRESGTLDCCEACAQACLLAESEVPRARPIRPFNDAPETQLRANLRAAWSELNQAQANLDRVVPRDCPWVQVTRAEWAAAERRVYGGDPEWPPRTPAR